MSVAACFPVTILPSNTRMSSDSMSYNCTTRFAAHIHELLSDLQSVGLKSPPSTANLNQSETNCSTSIVAIQDRHDRNETWHLQQLVVMIQV